MPDIQSRVDDSSIELGSDCDRVLPGLEREIDQRREHGERAEKFTERAQVLDGQRRGVPPSTRMISGHLSGGSRLRPNHSTTRNSTSKALVVV